MALTEEQLAEIEPLVREGHRIATIAKKFGVSRQALYNRMRRDHEFRSVVRSAEADAEMLFLQKLQAAIIKQRAWQGFAWILERRFGWLSAADELKNEERRQIRKAEREIKKGASSTDKWRAAISMIPGRSSVFDSDDVPEQQIGSVGEVK